MNIENISKQLSKIQNPNNWSKEIAHLSSEEKSQCVALAEPLWVERMISNGYLLVHPDIAKELKQNEWKPNQLHRKMIWASVLVSIDGETSKEQFQDIKKRLKKKYGFA
ncbi:hypothetical protein ACTL6P_24780 [Endozoicomonas acroporae]|uniref:hypothetical protein n=1 Tax=Endozoicomonas acroporae TaxID=1701104 RepID=UPI0011AEE36A|nr:hypothetical protein [Endozoicomonas acroporae]